MTVCGEPEGEGGVTQNWGMQGTLSEGLSGFMFTLFHLVFHHGDERDGLTTPFMCASQLRMTRLVVLTTPHVGGRLCHLYKDEANRLANV